jgi:uncharacterized protein YndB with AHSA1/START domain
MANKAVDIGTITREVRIDAPQDVVFAYLTQPDRIVEWMGREVIAEARPGGVFQVDMNGFDVMRGQFVEVTPYSRVVFTMGWLSLTEDAVRPGSSTVEFTLADEGGATLVRLVHSGLPEMAVPPHAEGWEFFISRLVEVATGRVVEQNPPLTTGEQLASRLNSLLIEAVDAIEDAPAARWSEPVPGDGRSAAAVADHISGHLVLANFAQEVANGAEPPPFTAEQLDAANAARAAEAAAIPPEEVVAAIRRDGPVAVTKVRELTDEQLAIAKPLSAAGGAIVSVEDLIQGALLGDIATHLAGFRAATGQG